MHIPVISGIMAAVREYKRKSQLKDALYEEFRTIVFLDFYDELNQDYDDAVLALRKKYEALGLSEQDTYVTINRSRMVRIEG